VDQFYSGLILSSILAPIGFVVRKLTSEISLLHPFAIASSNPVSVIDFDRITKPGPLALFSVIKYSIWRTLVQSILMIVGWLLVPIGTLAVTTGSFIPTTVGNATVPMPTTNGSVCPLHATMNTAANPANITGFHPALNSSDMFLELAAGAFQGNLLGRSDQLPEIPREIGTMPHLSMSFTPDVTYHSIVTYPWAGNCEDAGDEVTYTMEQQGVLKYVNFTFPDGSVQGTALDPTQATKYSRMFFWTSESPESSDIQRRNSVNYYAVAALQGTSLSMEYDTQLSNEPNSTGILLDHGIWIARTKCQPTLSWRVSTCTWDGSFMRNCVPDKMGRNIKGLDTVGLDALTEYMTAVQWSFQEQGDIFYSWDPWPNYSPTTEHFESLHGILALSIVSVSSMSSWGTIPVKTVGEPLRQVYIVRIYILILVAAMLVVVSLLSTLDITYSIMTKKPFKKTTFLTVAKAVRGQWWDETLGCDGTKCSKGYRECGQARVIYVADEEDGDDDDINDSVGLIPVSYGSRKDSESMVKGK
jgi:hypothetical protein